jgi:hypothetical protein
MVDTSAAGGGGAYHYGMDTSLYPGDAVMQAWWNCSPFCYTGFYLAPAPYHQDTSWMNKRPVLLSHGWGFMPVYVGRQTDSSYLDTGTGANEADQAASLARCAGFPPQTIIFLDIETSQPLSDRYLSYVIAWVNELRRKGYQAGIYCYSPNANQIRRSLFTHHPPGIWRPAEFWVARYVEHGFPPSIPRPACSGVPFASVWQFAGDLDLTYGGYTSAVDLNTSVYTDPSTLSRDFSGRR